MNDENNPFSRYLEGSESPLDKTPIEGTRHFSADLPKTEDLPENTATWVKNLIEQINKNPKYYQTERFLIEFEARKSNGPVSSKTPEELISTAEIYPETDILRSWYLRQAAFEYLLKYLKEDDQLARRETITLLSAILDGDELLATEIVDALAQR